MLSHNYWVGGGGLLELLNTYVLTSEYPAYYFYATKICIIIIYIRL